MAGVLKQDVFRPVMFSSPALNVSLEQADHIRRVLDKVCSDSRFAEKAFVSIWYVLTAGNTPASVVTSLVPASAVIGSPSFTLHVRGTGFTAGTIIVFNGYHEPTTFVNDTEVTTGVNMPLWAAPVVVPVAVLSDTGILSDPKSFEFTAVARTVSKTDPSKTEVVTTKK